MMQNIRLLLAGLMIVLLAACTKDDGPSGPPVIHRVSLLDSSKMDSAFVRALPGALILITGENLQGATHVLFNNFDSYFNQAYNTNTHIIINIPENATTEATDRNVPNELRIKTDRGDAVFKFTLDIPPPAITQISNENALPGDSVLIFGSSLWLINKITLPGNREITQFSANPEGTRVGFKLPDLGTDTGRLSVVAKYGTAVSNGPLNDHQSGDVISNFTNDGEVGELPRLNWAWWGADRINDATKFPGTRGFYLNCVFGGVGVNNGAWWEGGRSGNFNETVLFTDAIRTRQASDYALKFEVNTKEPWTTAVCVLRFGENYAVRWKPWSSLPGNSFHTENTWTTVTVQLSAFKTVADGVEGTGASAASMADLVAAGGKVAFTFRMVSEDKPIEVFNAAFDNFRIVKIK
ncbi:glycan-binding surface protein [Chitinophaga caseinilytica]|uniref:glycan-binding surface protein n=1 Tax=Chitinophaga caseinilytica TaxID=2267521 RepID=UPI003C2CC7B2